MPPIGEPVASSTYHVIKLHTRGNIIQTRE